MHKNQITRARIAESIRSIFFIARLVTFLTGIVAAISLAIFLLEQLIHDISVQNWLAGRWWIPVMFLGLLFWGAIKRKLAKNSELSQLADESDLLEAPTGDGKLAPFAVRGIRYGENLIAPVTISTNSNGIEIWKAGKLWVLLGWMRVKEISTRVIAKDQYAATVVFLSKSTEEGPTNKQLVIPWKPSFTSCVPKSVRMDEPHPQESQ